MVKYTHKRSQHKRSQHKRSQHKRSQHKRTHKQTGGADRIKRAAEFYIKGAEYLSSEKIVSDFIKNFFIPYLNHKKITSQEMNKIHEKIIKTLNPKGNTANPISKYLLDYTTYNGKEWVYQYNPYKDTPLDVDRKMPSPIHEIIASQGKKASLVRQLRAETKVPTIYGKKNPGSLLINEFPLTPSPSPRTTRKRKSKKSPEERENTPRVKSLKGSPLNVEYSSDPSFTDIEFKTPQDLRKKTLRYGRHVLPPHDV